MELEKKKYFFNKLNKNEKILFFLLFLPCFLINRNLDNDIWALLNSGRYVVNYGMPHIEPFTIHGNLGFVLQQWLTDVIFWKTYSVLGEKGLFLIVTLCYMIIIFLMFKLTLKISDENFFVSYTITLASSILLFFYMVTRPTIFTLIIVLIELNILECFVKSKNNKYLLILPILSLLLINLHAALWPILFVMLIPYLLNSFKFKLFFINNEGFEKKYLVLIIVGMIIVAFINPYGLDAMTYLLKSTGSPYMNNILEIKPPFINSLTGAIIYSYISIIIFIYIFYKKGTTTIRYLFLTMGTTYMVLTSIRNITYFGICGLFPLSYYLKDVRYFERNFETNKNNKLRISLVIIILSVLIAIFTLKVFDEKNDSLSDYANLNSTIDYILNNEDITKIKVYTGFNDGGLVQYRGIKTYIDPRAEVYFKKHNNKEDIFDEYFKLQSGKIYYKEFVDKYNFTHLILTKSDLLYIYIQKDEDYKIVYSNEEYYLFERN